MGRAPCCDKASVKKGPWSPEEDRKLRDYIHKHGTAGNWIALPHKAGLKRCGKSCRLRWLNYLRPNIKHGDFSDDEDRVICSLVATIGSRWSIIAAQLPGRTDNDIKNYWNTKLKKKLMGLQLQASTPRSSHSQQQQQHLFFPAATPPLLGNAGTSAAAAAHDIHLFSQSLHHHQVHHLAGAAAAAAPHHYSSTGSSSCSAPQLATALFGIGGDQQQMPTTTSSSCFDLCNGSGVGLESFVFGGFDTMTGGGGGATLLLDEHHQYMSSSCDHEMKPFLVVPSGSTATASASSLLYGEAAGTALLQAKGDYYLN